MAANYINVTRVPIELEISAELCRWRAVVAQPVSWWSGPIDATILRPYYPVSDLYRIVRDDDGLQVDFMGTIHGVRSFAGVRDRAGVVAVPGVDVLVASLTDIIKSKKAARRPRDLAVLEVLEKAREEADLKKSQTGRRRERK